MGPTVWITQRAGSRNPGVALASPGGQPPSGRHAARRSGPAARWMAPSTPPPPRSDELAALTMASTASVVMSPRHASTAVIEVPSSEASCNPPLRDRAVLGDNHIVVVTRVPSSRAPGPPRRVTPRQEGHNDAQPHERTRGPHLAGL